MYKIKQAIYDKPRGPIGLLPFIIIAFLATIGLLLYFMVSKGWLGTKPVIELVSSSTGAVIDMTQPVAASRKIGFSIQVKGQGNHICLVEASLQQGDQKWSLINQAFDQEVVVIKPEADLSALGVKPEPLTLNVQAQNCSLFKTRFAMSANLSPDFMPPIVGITSQQHYVNQGGSDVVTYSVSPDTVWSGVRVGPYQFDGFDKPGGGKGEKFAFFVHSYELPAGTPVEVVAIDAAGNEAKTIMPIARFFPKQFRQRELPISDDFIATKVMTIISNTPGLTAKGQPVDDFLQVNRDLRKKNAAFLTEISKQSESRFLWKDAFVPLKNAAVEANFADYRSYIYNGQKVDEQVHLGFDLAITEKAPVMSAQAGKVIFADYLGIYGNTILIDHGYGLITLYGHLSAMDFTVGQTVGKNQKIGNSGVTGLAGGDHLHFSLLIQGVQANPVEFWDQHWIEDHVYLRLGKSAFSQP